jgi:hypothetical protein
MKIRGQDVKWYQNSGFNLKLGTRTEYMWSLGAKMKNVQVFLSSKSKQELDQNFSGAEGFI